MNYRVIMLSALWQEICKGTVQVEKGCTTPGGYGCWQDSLTFNINIEGIKHTHSMIWNEKESDFAIKTALYEIQELFVQLFAKKDKDRALAVSHVVFELEHNEVKKVC